VTARASSEDAPAMIAVLLSSLLLGHSSGTPIACAPVALDVHQDGLDAKIAEAGTDVQKLLDLAASFLGGPQQGHAEKVYKRVIEIDPENETARTALRHQPYDGKWFESFAELAKYKREEAARMKAKGLARWKEEWVPEADVPFLSMGWTKSADGKWTDPVAAARAKQIDEWTAAGFQFRADDNSWIAPADSDKWAALQWKCGDAWLDMAKANEFHAKLEQPWELAGEHFVTWSTCEWNVANSVRWHADKVHAEMLRIFGVAPTGKPHFFVLNNLQQYNQAAGNQPILIESEGISSLHGAYFADAYYDTSTQPPRFEGCGVSYWDSTDPKLAAWGPFWVRWAAAQSFADAIDRSWAAIGAWVESAGRGDLATYPGPFWGEKKIPRWLRYGAASYAERFMKNPEAAEGTDPWTLRAFACAEIMKSGGLRKLDDVFAFRLDLADIPKSSRLYDEAGLVVAFLLDGAPEDKELASLHEAFKTKLKSGDKDATAAAAKALQAGLVKREKDIRKFAGI
jgi:hypothetical protein